MIPRQRKWEWAAVGVVLAVAVRLLFIPPIVGVADQGDYYRLIARVGLTPLPGLTTNEIFKCWLIVPWNVVAPQPLHVFSTAEWPAWIAVLFTRLSRATHLDIRWVAGVNLCFLLGFILVILRACRKLPMAASLVAAAGVVLVATDSEYLSYFNSFYGESAALLGVFALVAAGLAAVMAEELSWKHMSAIAMAAAFLAGSKAQNAILGPLAACWLVWLFRAKTAQRYASMAVGLGLVGFSAFVVARATAPESNLFNAIYDRVLPNTEDRPRALAELGLNPDTAAWTDKGYWEVKIESPDVFPGKASPLTLLIFYLRHPLIDLRMAKQALTLNNDVPYLGNYPKESGMPCNARTRAFTFYERWRMHLASLWFLVPLLGVNIAAVFFWRTRMGGLISTLGVMATVAFLIGAFYDNEPRKHLFTFNVLFDVLLFADLAAGTVRVCRMRIWNEEPVRKAVATAALPLLLLLTFTEAGGAPVFNWAANRPATQSSTLAGYASARAGGAVDEQTDGAFDNGSVSSTGRDTNAWWQVDLGSSKSIGSIVIWNRTDCCPSRLGDYWVFASDTPFSQSDTPATLQSRAGTWRSHQTVAPEPSTTMAVGARGRYVRVQLDGTDYLSLAEVQVFGR